MTTKQNAEGLMAPSSKANKSVLLEHIKTIFGGAIETLTLEERLAKLTSSQVQQLKIQLPLLRLHSQIARQSDLYMSHAEMIAKHYKGLKGSDSAMYSDLLETIDPTPERPIGYAPAPVRSQRNYISDYQDQFLAALTQSESSGNPNAEITIKDGRRFVGKLQFGEARLKDYMVTSGKSFTQDEFKADTALQDEVAEWHFADIDKAIDALGNKAEGYDRDGLRAVAHIGGKGGMAKWAQTNGSYNPSDELGTSLSDYYEKFNKGYTLAL